MNDIVCNTLIRLTSTAMKVIQRCRVCVSQHPSPTSCLRLLLLQTSRNGELLTDCLFCSDLQIIFTFVGATPASVSVGTISRHKASLRVPDS